MLYFVKQFTERITEKYEKEILIKIGLSNFLFHFFGNYQLALLTII